MRNVIFHPIALGIYPALALYAYNLGEIDIYDALRSILVSLFATILLWILLRLLLKDWGKASLVCSLAIVLFFSYGHLYDLLRDTQLMGLYLFRHRLLGALWLGLFILGVWWIVRKLRDPGKANAMLNLVAAVALIFPVYSFLNYQIQSSERLTDNPSLETLTVTDQSNPDLPDVYYIILDEYSRDDFLLQGFDYDNSAFLQALEQRGFYIAKCSQSNYSQTRLSLVSSLNMDYLENFYTDRYKDQNDIDRFRNGMIPFIKHSIVRKTFERLGYQIITFETGFDFTEIEDADLYLTPGGQAAKLNLFKGANDFEVMMIRSTGLLFLSAVSPNLADVLLPNLDYPNKIQRERVLFALDALEKLPSAPGLKFVFAHIGSPHKPFVFGPNGEVLEREPIYPVGYPDQITYINSRIIPIVDTILQDSDVPPIIIIQGDHGARQNVGEFGRLGILNAYYLPGEGESHLYPTISPVNTFRIIFREYFGMDYALLDDVSNKSQYTDPLNYLIIQNNDQPCNR